MVDSSMIALRRLASSVWAFRSNRQFYRQLLWYGHSNIKVSGQLCDCSLSLFAEASLHESVLHPKLHSVLTTAPLA
jgi:hypothetical protein